MIRHALAAAALTLAAAAPASAQGQATRNATVPPGKVTRVAVVTALKRDCTNGALGSIRVVTGPKNGKFEIRGGKRKTPANFRCPNVDTATQELLYEPNRNYQGADEIAYETRSSDGATETVTLKITVTSKPASGGTQDL